MRHCRHDGPERGARSPRGEHFGRGEHLGRHRHRGDFGGRGGRIFEQGDLRYVLFALIAEKPRHGYELIKEIEERLGGAYSPSPGIVYPTLTLLEELGFIAAQDSAGAKKAYAITGEGREALETNKATVDGLFARMAAVAERSGGRPAPQIVRAMENLSLALRLKLERGALTPSQVEAIAQALDAAARAVERD